MSFKLIFIINGGFILEKVENVVRYYVLCNKLKNVIRTGWIDWNVNNNRIESVAEHIYSCQMLAIAMYSEFNYDIDIMKVIMMLAVHELEEILIGDLTQFQITKEKKKKIGHEAVTQILSGLFLKDKIEELIFEFDERNTKEAKFAYYCDKLECDLQSRLYDEYGCVDLNKQENNMTFNDSEVQALLGNGMSFSEMWLTFGQNKYNYDDKFLSVSNYALNNKISSFNKEIDDYIKDKKRSLKKK